MKKFNLKSFVAGILGCAIMFSFTVYAEPIKKTLEATFSGINLKVYGKETTLKDANGKATELFDIDGTTYVPINSIANALDLKVTTDDSSQTIKVNKKILGFDDRKLSWNMSAEDAMKKQTYKIEYDNETKEGKNTIRTIGYFNVKYELFSWNMTTVQYEFYNRKLKSISYNISNKAGKFGYLDLITLKASIEAYYKPCSDAKVRNLSTQKITNFDSNKLYDYGSDYFDGKIKMGFTWQLEDNIEMRLMSYSEDGCIITVITIENMAKELIW